MSNTSDLNDYVYLYAGGIEHLQGYNYAEIMNILVIRDSIEQLLGTVPLYSSVTARLRLLRLDGKLATQKRYLVEVVRGQGETQNKPASYWWWYLDIAEGKKAQASLATERRPDLAKSRMPVPAPAS